MDKAEFERLWEIGASCKRSPQYSATRQPIGKFGIGKLATYLLCNKLTYICKKAEGPVLTITTTYSDFDSESDSLAFQTRSLEVRRIGAEMDPLLDSLNLSADLRDTLQTLLDVSHKTGSCAYPSWTLAVLSDLKDKARDIQVGRLKYILASSLPLGDQFKITFNEEPLAPTKLSKSHVTYDLTEITPDGTAFECIPGNGAETATVRKRTDGLYIDDTGPITGTLWLFDDIISSGKSEDLAASNGIFVKVRDRLVNTESDDRAFGIKDLRYGTFSRSRIEISCSALDSALQANREDFGDSVEIRAFRGYIKWLFNFLRSEEQNKSVSRIDQEVKDVLSAQWDKTPSIRFRELVRGAITQINAYPHLFSTSHDVLNTSKKWEKDAPTIQPIDSIQTKSGQSPDAPLHLYDANDRTIVINEDHPFFRKVAMNGDPIELVKKLAFADTLAISYLNEAGLSHQRIDEYYEYKDHLLRLALRAQLPDLLDLIQGLQLAAGEERGLEFLLHRSLEALGFSVRELGGSGEPEGVATAILPNSEDEVNRRYSFTYDAKSTSSTSGKVVTGNVNIAGIVRHRVLYSADYALVVAPNFQKGALEAECKQSCVTPMRISTLVSLLKHIVSHGRFPLTDLKRIFQCTDPDSVDKIVQELIESSRQSNLTLDMIFEAFEARCQKDARLTVDLLADEIDRKHGLKAKSQEISRFVLALQDLLPRHISVIGTVIVLSIPGNMIKAEVTRKLCSWPELSGDLC